MEKDELRYYYSLQLLMNGYRLDGDDDSGESKAKKSKGGNIGLPYGLCQAVGIKVPEGASPKEAWDLLSEKGIEPKQVYSSLKEGKKDKDIVSGSEKKEEKSEPFTVSNKKGFSDLPKYHGDNAGLELEKGYSFEKGLSVAKKIESALKHGFGKTNVKLMKPGSKGSMSNHISKKGDLSFNRERLHQAIIGKHLDGISKPSGQPIYTFLGGGPASGKSTVLNSGAIDYVPDKKNAVYVDPDAFKTYLPEYQMALKDKDSRAGAYCHEESGLIGRRIEWIGRENGYNLVSDGTGDRSASYMKERIQKARDAGMKVNGLYMTCDVEKAVERSYKRFQETGRLVPESNVRSIHQSVSQIFPQIASDFDHVELYDTDGDKPVKIAECNHGEKIKVIDKEKYDKFLKKANAWW